jgi:hypothetical protein
LSASRTKTSTVGLDLHPRNVSVVLDEELSSPLHMQGKPDMAILTALSRFVAPPHGGNGLKPFLVTAVMDCRENDPTACVVNSRDLARHSLMISSHHGMRAVTLTSASSPLHRPARDMAVH